MTTVTAAAQTQVLSTAKVMETWNPYASRATPTRGWVILWLTAYYMDRTILGVDDPEIGDQVNRARCSCGRSDSAKFVVGSCCCRFRFLIKACPELCLSLVALAAARKRSGLGVGVTQQRVAPSERRS